MSVPQQGKQRLPEALEPHIEVVGNHKIVVEGCKGVTLYQQNVIELTLVRQRLRILGDELSMEQLITGDAMITGKLFSVEWVE